MAKTINGLASHRLDGSAASHGLDGSAASHGLNSSATSRGLDGLVVGHTSLAQKGLDLQTKNSVMLSLGFATLA